MDLNGVCQQVGAITCSSRRLYIKSAYIVEVRMFHRIQFHCATYIPVHLHLQISILNIRHIQSVYSAIVTSLCRIVLIMKMDISVVFASSTSAKILKQAMILKYFVTIDWPKVVHSWTGRKRKFYRVTQTKLCLNPSSQ